MDINPQYTYDKQGNPVGVFISIDEWNEVSDALHLEIPEWQRKALDAEIELFDSGKMEFLRWEDIKDMIIS